MTGAIIEPGWNAQLPATTEVTAGHGYADLAAGTQSG